ncbi:MAG TPA: ABC transporter permease [Candidatus Baltobacteraceae bacterium]|nr:ABC transporter permease [Candidatus Baltobacteraceae bacterium]
MRPLRVWLMRFAGLFGTQRRDQELAAELESHLRLHIEDNVRAGMPPEEARRQALLQLGGLEQTKESYRDRRGLPWLESLLQDTRFGLRMLRKSPGLTFALVFSLTLGIGVNAAVFSVVNGFLLRPLPVSHPEQVVVLASHQQGDTLGITSFSYPDLVDFRNQGASVFSDVFAWKLWIAALGADGRADQVYASCVTGNYFSALGLKAALGRFFYPGEGEQVGAETNVVLGYAYWQRRFGGDPGVIGKAVRLDGDSATVIGVAPKGFQGTFSLMTMDAYFPMSQAAKEQENAGLFTDRSVRQITAMARLRRGVTRAEAQNAVNVIADRLAAQYADADKGNSIRVLPETLARPTPEIGSLMPVVAGLFLILAAMVLLLVCVNVVSVLMARATLRGREMAVRAALGAGRGRLLRQMLTEALLLSALGGLAGVILGAWASRSLISLLPRSSVPVTLDFHFDWRVAAYSAAIVFAAGIIVGWWPALRSTRANLGEVLHEGGRSDSAGGTRHRARSVLVAMQVAGSLMLLIVAALFARSLKRAESMYLGFDPAHVAYVVTDAYEVDHDQARTKQMNRALEDRMRALPGAESVSLSYNVPMSLFNDGSHVYIEEHPLRAGQQAPLVMFNLAEPAYFTTMRVPIVRGRSFTESDNEKSVPVAIVDQTMAEEFWPGEDPIGKRFSVDAAPNRFLQIVGVSAKGAYSFVGEDSQPFFYLPLAQSWNPISTVEVRSSAPLEPLLVEMQRQVRNLSPDVPILDAETMEQCLGGLDGFFVFRLGALLAGVMGFIALALAVVGVYGVIAFSTTQRTNEIGIRMALGADSKDILRLVLRQGIAIVSVGVIAGLIGGWALARAMGRFAAGPSNPGPIILGGAALLLTFVALAASYIPARRASRVDPMVALRHE